MNNGKSATAQCKAACPAGVDVPRYIRYIREGKFGAALAVIREKIPFPAVCGYACVHPCESKCARVQYDEPVAIRLLKRAAQEYGQEEWAGVDNATPSGKKVAVIGAGPCGLTAAYYLAIQGHEVTVYEALPAPGGMLRYGIPAYRLPNHVLDREIAFIEQQGVKIHTSSPVSVPRKLLSQGFDSVLITIGAWKGLKLGVEGENSPRVINGLNFLQEVNAGRRPDLGARVVVVGGGNTAIDAARAAVRLGARVTVLYRRTRQQMPAHPEEVRDAMDEGVSFTFLAAPVKITDGQVTCVQMTLGAEDASGRPRPVPVEGSEFTLPFDTLIVAAGQAVNSGFLEVAARQDGTIEVNQDTFATSEEGLFAAGDAVTGPSSIIEAIAQGRLASMAMDKYLGGSGVIDRPVEDSASLAVPDTAPRGTGRVRALSLTTAERLAGFKPVEFGYDREAAMAEAGRCLACDLRDCTVQVNSAVCKGCTYCKEVCSLDVFQVGDSFNARGYKPVVVADNEKCVGCLRCLFTCPDFAITVDCRF